jgi:single-stranded DNA-binding protein
LRVGSQLRKIKINTMEEKKTVQLMGYVTEPPREEKGVDGLRVFMRLEVLQIAGEEKSPLFESQWHDVVARGDLAVYAVSHIPKGMCILVEGSLESGNLESVEQDGGGKTYVLAESILKVGS